MCTCDFGGGPSFRGPVRGAVSFPYISLCKPCYRISSVAKYYRDQIWSYIVGPIAKLCMCQFGPVKIPGGPRRGHSWKFNPPASHKIGCSSVIQYFPNLIWPRSIFFVFNVWCWFSYGLLINSNNVWIWGIIQICKTFARILQISFLL